MKITSLETILLSVPPPEPIRWSGGVLTMIHASLIEVRTDEGITGLGEPYLGIFAPEATRGIVEALAPLVVGEDPTDVAGVYHRLRAKTLFWARNGAGLSVIGAIETALWDILGKVRGLPVYELLGGKVHQRLPVYASGGLDKSLDQTVDEMKRYRAQGLKAVKVRVGMGLRLDVPKIERVRKAIGPDMDLMVDAVQGHNPEPWSASQAIEVARALEPYRIRWFEEPCGATDYAGYAQVRHHTPIAVAGGESSVSAAEFRNFFEAGALDIVQPDTSHAGGIIETRRIAELAASYGVGVALHSWASSALLAPNYHLAFALPNCRILEYPTWGYPLIEELFVEPLRIENGYVLPPAGPGLGIHIPGEVRAKYPFRGGPGAVMQRMAESGS
ncbi:MAG: mandelate racemase/muconate lactonizing enzyme family protein [Acidobacteria bacterium]|nr:mandelate racemase/muconate lactonizing enzyme family protein [Acidobacteriota bacterium]